MPYEKSNNFMVLRQLRVHFLNRKLSMCHALGTPAQLSVCNFEVRQDCSRKPVLLRGMSVEGHNRTWMCVCFLQAHTQLFSRGADIQRCRSGGAWCAIATGLNFKEEMKYALEDEAADSRRLLTGLLALGHWSCSSSQQAEVDEVVTDDGEGENEEMANDADATGNEETARHQTKAIKLTRKRR